MPASNMPYLGRDVELLHDSNNSNNRAFIVNRYDERLVAGLPRSLPPCRDRKVFAASNHAAISSAYPAARPGNDGGKDLGSLSKNASIHLAMMAVECLKAEIETKVSKGTLNETLENSLGVGGGA